MAEPTTLQGLIASLQNNTYTPPTQEQMQQTASNRYQSHYAQLGLAAQQAQQTTDLSLQQQLANQASMYDRQLTQNAENYRRAYSQADRQALGRGMQRSSYNAQTLANVNIAGNRAANEIMDARTQAAGQIEAQRTQLAQQLAQQLQQYSASQASDILAYIDELESQGYDRLTQAQQYNNSLASQIYQFANTEAQQAQAQSNWLAQFNAQYGGRGGGGGGNNRYTPTTRDWQSANIANRISYGGGNNTDNISNYSWANLVGNLNRSPYANR
jgi:hypothetical protein